MVSKKNFTLLVDTGTIPIFTIFEHDCTTETMAGMFSDMFLVTCSPKKKKNLDIEVH